MNRYTFNLTGEMMKFILMIAVLCLSTQALSVTTYKCSENSVVSYQFKPCNGASKQVVIEDNPTKKEDIDAGGSLEKDILLGEFSVKPDHQDSFGSQWFVYKVMVTNRTNTERKMSLQYKAVDYQGFLITEVYLRGSIPPLSSETLTDKNFVEQSAFYRIQKWVLNK